MKGSVGVTHSGFSAMEPPKCELLFFDRIGVMDLRGAILWNRRSIHGEQRWADEWEWLAEQGIVFEPEVEFLPEQLQTAEYTSCLKVAIEHSREATKLEDELFPFPYDRPWEKISEGYYYVPGSGRPIDDYDRFEERFKQWDSHNWASISLFARCTAVELRTREKINAVSAVPIPDFILGDSGPATRSDVVQIVLSAVPVPDYRTSLEQILDFKNDPDSQGKLLALNNWMGEVARAELTSAEVEEKLKYLLYQYQKHMELHHMKVDRGILETVVVTTAELAEDIAKVKWSDAAKMLFALKRKKLLLLEAEAEAPGREVAYVVKARETFSATK